jgi:PLP dependent protein
MAISHGMSVLSQFQHTQSAIRASVLDACRQDGDVTLVAVSKTYDGDHIRPVLEAGHRVFGENRVQEALQKWPPLRAQYGGVELHLIGPLQSNKAADAVMLFDVIQTVDRKKIADALAAEITRQQRNVRLFVQVNTGLEPQKAGVAPKDVGTFLNYVRNDLACKVEGLMCIPPVEENPASHFHLLQELAKAFGVHKLSMGMSADFESAIAQGATHVRVGSGIFGVRTP